MYAINILQNKLKWCAFHALNLFRLFIPELFISKASFFSIQNKLLTLFCMFISTDFFKSFPFVLEMAFISVCFSIVFIKNILPLEYLIGKLFILSFFFAVMRETFSPFAQPLQSFTRNKYSEESQNTDKTYSKKQSTENTISKRQKMDYLRIFLCFYCGLHSSTPSIFFWIIYIVFSNEKKNSRVWMKKRMNSNRCLLLRFSSNIESV